MPCRDPSRRRPRPPRAARAALALALALSAAAAAADQARPVLASDAAPYRHALDAFAAKVAASPPVLLAAVAEDPVALGGARVVVAIGTPAAVWAHGHLPPDARLVYCMVTRPEETELVEPPAASGVAIDIPFAEQIALIGEALPAARRIGILHHRDDAGLRLAAALRAALPQGWSLEAVPIDGAANAEAIDEVLGRKVDVVWTSSDGGIYNEAAVRSLLLGALRRRVPVFGFSPAFVRAGALLGVGIDPATQGEQAAAVVEQLAATPEAAPLRPPPRFQIALNLVVARKLGVQLPDQLVDRATHVFRPDR